MQAKWRRRSRACIRSPLRGAVTANSLVLLWLSMKLAEWPPAYPATTVLNDRGDTGIYWRTIVQPGPRWLVVGDMLRPEYCYTGSGCDPEDSACRWRREGWKCERAHPADSKISVHHRLKVLKVGCCGRSSIFLQAIYIAIIERGSFFLPYDLFLSDPSKIVQFSCLKELLLKILREKFQYLDELQMSEIHAKTGYSKGDSLKKIRPRLFLLFPFSEFEIPFNSHIFSWFCRSTSRLQWSFSASFFYIFNA